MGKTKKWLIYAVSALMAIGLLVATQVHSEKSSEEVGTTTSVTPNIITIESGSTIEYHINNSNVCLSVEAYFKERYELTASQTATLAKVVRESCAAGIDERKAAAIVWAESRARNVCSYMGCDGYGAGVFQFLESTFRYYGCTGSRLNVDDNIQCGVKVLKLNGDSDWRPYSGSVYMPLYYKIIEYEKQKRVL